MDTARKTIVYTLIAVIGVALIIWLVISNTGESGLTTQEIVEQGAQGTEVVEADQYLNMFNPQVARQMEDFPLIDLSQANIDRGQVFGGGPRRDGIPPIDDPKYVSVDESPEDESTEGVLIDINGDRRFYPYSIMVWHEIVNDTVGGQPVSVTFCPLCGSAIVYDRRVNGVETTFGVSGFLFESNLLMYDRQTESLWSQARGEGVIGVQTGIELAVVPMNLTTFGQAAAVHPDMLVLSRDTGARRNYDQVPYGNYNDTEELFFPISVRDNRFPTKEIMTIIPFGEQSIALAMNRLDSASTFEIGGEVLTAAPGPTGIVVTNNAGQVLPTYVEMWFSWATHHQDNGIVWELE